MEKHLALVGAGHAHLAALLAGAEFISKGHHVTLITPSTYFYYSGMGPGLLSGRYSPQDVRFHVKKMAEDRGLAVVLDSVARIDARHNLLMTASGAQIAYDVASFNIGSQVPSELLAEPNPNVLPVKPIENLLKARRRLLESKDQRILVVGGGPAGFEISCNLASLLEKERKKTRITLIAGESLLPRLPEKGRRIAKQALSGHCIELIEGKLASRIERDTIQLDSGKELPFDFAFLAVGIDPSPLFRSSNLQTGHDGGLLVNQFLQSVDYPNIFGAGDCISFQPRPLDKVGVYSVRESAGLLNNLMTTLEDGPTSRRFQPFRPQESYLLIFNLGDGRGLFWRKNWVWDGRLAFCLKEWLDKRFVKKYQVSGEHDEPERAD
jgi:NADH dehydrogenase FAD-containing subunit